MRLRAITEVWGGKVFEIGFLVVKLRNFLAPLIVSAIRCFGPLAKCSTGEKRDARDKKYPVQAEMNADLAA